MNNNKEFLYVGHYIDTKGNYILKIGTTNDLQRRRNEHTTNYRKSKNYQLPKGERFCYDWYHPLSKYNTLRFEDRTRDAWIAANVGEYVPNDRFNCGKTKPETVIVTIKKTYEISL